MTTKHSAAPSWLVAPTRRSRVLMPPASLWRAVLIPSKGHPYG
jgi:hypothetical protein